MKKKLLVLAAAALSLTVAVSGTLAYFTDTGIAHNVITSGGIDVEIEEWQEMPSEGTPGIPFEDISGIMPGGKVSKIVTVANKATSSESWIRVWVNIGISESGNPILHPTIKNLPLTIPDPAGGEDIPVVTLDFNLGNEPNHWTLGEDHYYYYNSPIRPSEVTEPLFTTVNFAPEMGNEYQNCKIMIDITAEAVQTANNPIPENGSVLDVWRNKNDQPIEILPSEPETTPEDNE